MKTEIHPTYTESNVTCTCGNQFVTRSTTGDIHVEICSACHPFYTGRQKLVDTGGRVERFQRRAAKGRRTKAERRKLVRLSAISERSVFHHRRLLMSATPEIRDAPLGGQAVLEGVMMRGVGTWAVAVRAPAPPDGADGAPGPIRVSSFAIAGAQARPGTGARASARERVPAARLPLVRGVVALWDSLSIGARALVISANAQLAALSGEDPGQTEIPRGVWIGSLVISLCFAVGLFFVVPVGATSLIRRQLGTEWLFWLVEGVLRTAIFLAYLGLLSRMRELRRVLEYHGAEHKVISCCEAGDELTPERAAGYSRLHPRCGTSFLLVVMIISIFVFAPIGLPAWWVLVLTRIAGVPVIAGLSFEVIRWVGRHRDKRLARWLMWPGLRLQLLTTREPDLEQLAVSIVALEAVLAAERPGEWAPEELLGLELVA